MNIPNNQIDILSKKYDNNWNEPPITYVGIQLSYPASKLYTSNFPKLSEQISIDLQNIKVQLSWVGKIAAFKMKTLPKILYFRSLPVLIPATFFTQINAKMKKFVWNEKKTRVAFDILTTIKELGRMGLPNIKNYYASLLDQIKFWFATPQ